MRLHRPEQMLRRRLFCTWLACTVVCVSRIWAADAEVLRPRVPPDILQNVRSVPNPLSPSPELIDKGRKLYYGKAFCAACHGQDGKGLGPGLELKGPLPRDFTDKAWQAVRSDGELFWILKNGSPSTDMAAFIPLVLTEEEAWQVLLYIRWLGAREGLAAGDQDSPQRGVRLPSN